MPQIKCEGWVPPNKAQESVDKLRGIFNDRVSLDITFDTYEAIQTKEIKKEPNRVEDFCKENRCWATKNAVGCWAWYVKDDKPYCKDKGWRSKRGGVPFSPISEIDFPTYIAWDKSLVAPDGRLILIEGKKEKKKKVCKFKVGKWYRSKIDNCIIHCRKIFEQGIMDIDGKNGPVIFCISDPSDWYEIKHYNPDKKKKSLELKRGEPVFVWDRYHNPRVPTVVRYFHSFDDDGNGIFTCNESLSNEQGTWYQYYRRYDSTLVGVPRKDWPKTSA